MSKTTKNFLSKKVIIAVAVLAVGTLSAVLVVPSLAQAIAQEQQEDQQRRRMMIWSGEGMPQINGSVNIANETTDFINENVNVSFVEAAQTAQGQVMNGTVLGGHLKVLQGYLVYTFFVAEIDNQMGHLVIVDAGNGNVLFTSEGQSLGSVGHPMMFGHWEGGHGGSGQWHGPGKPHWFGGGMWR
jgi:uncharacterized membrane protein YkoI